jgi:hypothetical protein
MFWVRSYTWLDTTALFGRSSLISYQGQVLCNTPVTLYGVSLTAPSFSPPRHGVSSIQHKRFNVKVGTGGIAFPHSFLTMLAIATGIMPWLRWRFSLRTLLLVTALVAVVLGLAMWAMRS